MVRVTWFGVATGLVAGILSPPLEAQIGGRRGAAQSRSAGMARPDVGPGQGPRTPYLEEDWENWWFLNQERVLDLRNRLSRLEEPGEFTDFRKLTDADRAGIFTALSSVFDAEAATLRSPALMALAKTGDARAVGLLVGALEDPSLEVRRAGLLGLGVCGGPSAVAALGARWRAERSSAEERFLAGLALGLAGGAPAMELMLPALSDLRSVARLPAPALTGLVRGAGLSEQVALLEPLLALWSERARLDLGPRVALVLALARLGGPNARRIVIDALEDDEAAVRRAAALAVGRFGLRADDEEMRRLVRIAEEEGDVTARNFLLLSIGRIGGDRSLQYLSKKLVGSPRGSVRGSFVVPRVSLSQTSLEPFAALGVGLSRDARAVDFMVGKLRGEKRKSNTAALAIALGLLGDERAASTLESLFRKNKEPVLRSRLALGLGLVGAKDGASALRRAVLEEHDPELLVGASVGWALLGQRSEAAEALLGRLRGKRKATARSALLYCVGLIGDQRAVEPLLALLADERENDATRAYAAVALGDLASRRQPRALAWLGVDVDYTTEPSLLLWLYGIL